MYNGDYSGRRFSALTKINHVNVSALTLAWVYRPNPGAAPAGGGGATAVTIKGTPVVVNGVMYVDDSRSRLGRRRAHRTRDLARDVALEGRVAHRQPRRRGAREDRLRRNARLQPRGARHAATARRSGAPRSATSSSSTTPPPRR